MEPSSMRLIGFLFVGALVIALHLSFRGHGNEPGAGSGVTAFATLLVLAADLLGRQVPAVREARSGARQAAVGFVVGIFAGWSVRETLGLPASVPWFGLGTAIGVLVAWPTADLVWAARLGCLAKRRARMLGAGLGILIGVFVSAIGVRWLALTRPATLPLTVSTALVLALCGPAWWSGIPISLDDE